jgi:hypothetical protein
MSDAIYGCEAYVVCRVRVSRKDVTGHYEETIEHVVRRIHRRGPRGRVERAARLLKGAVRVERIDQFTEPEWRQMFGVGTEHGAYRGRL